MPDKPRERFYFEALRAAVPEIPSGEPLEPEPPDFLLTTDQEKKLGIELTSFHLAPPRGEQPHQERQSLKDRIVARAERIHHEAGGPALYVEVHFNENRRLRKKDIHPLAHAVAASVLNAPLPRSINEPVELQWGRRPEATRGIQLLPSVDGEDRLWHADMGGWVATISAEDVADTVRSKARKAAEARRLCDELWLVIVNDAFSRAAPAEISTAAMEAVYEAPFDRLIWLVPQPPRAVELRLMSPVA